MPPRRRAFTTIELLAAIAIIIILGGILLYAVSAVLRTARANATKVTLENAVGMLNEYEQNSKLSAQSKPNQWYFNGGPINTMTETNFAQLDFWHVPEADFTNLASPIPLPIAGPTSVADGSAGRNALDTTSIPLSAGTSKTGTASDAMDNTVIVFQKMESVANIRAEISKMSADKLYVVQNAGILPAGVAMPTLLLDGWNNPIIYVPSTGLQTYINGQAVIVTAPDKRPFFASAGPDGKFADPKTLSGGEDNVYSFEK